MKHRNAWGYCAGAAGIALIAALAWHFAPRKSAVIVDQLSLGMPNLAFIETATRLLESTGYRVTYIPQQDVTVEFYRRLPARGDDLILLRVHSSGRLVTKSGTVVDDSSISLCTGEPLSKAYPKERNSGQLGGFETLGTERLFFSVRGEFFARSASGKFPQSVIVIMGCEGLRIPRTAEIFLDLGAQAVIGWNDQISTNVMDASAAAFLEAWLRQRQTLKAAVATARRSVESALNDPQIELKMMP